MDAASGSLTQSNTTGVITVYQNTGAHTINSLGVASGANLVLAGSPSASTTINNTLSSSGTANFNGGFWTLPSGGNYGEPIVVNSGTILRPSNTGDTFNMANFTIHGGRWTCANQYGMRMGSTFGANSNTGNNFTGYQDGGIVSTTVSSFDIGSSSMSCTAGYVLTGGTMTSGSNINFYLGADTGGTGTAAFALSGSGVLVVGGAISGYQPAPAVQVFAFTGGTLSAATINATNLQPSVSGTSGTFVNSGGTLAPGAFGAPGKMTVTGNLSMASNAVLAIDVLGTNQGTAFQNGTNYYDYLSVSGTATLGGLLAVSVTGTGGTFTPSSANTFTVLGSSLLTGSFSNVAFGNRLVTTGTGGSFVVSSSANKVTLSAYAPYLAPSGLTGTCVNGSMQLSWTVPTGVPAGAAYVVNRSQTSGGPYTPIATGTGAAFSDPGLTGGATYYYAVSASYGGIVAPLSSQVSAIPIAITGSSFAMGTRGCAFSYQITASGNPTAFTSTPLPSGLTLNAATGWITGTPTGSGTTVVTVGAANAGASSSAALTITIGNGSPPTVYVPSNMTMEATGPGGAAVSFVTSAIDSIDGPLPTVANPPSGSPFPLGTTTIVVTATNGASQGGTNSFTITVRDTTPPAIITPSNSMVYAMTATGANVTFSTFATDLVSGSVATTSVPPSGSFFPIDVTTVVTTATDAAGNSTSKNFTVTVAVQPIAPSETTAPKITLSGSTVFLTVYPSVPGRTYKMQRAVSLISGSWTYIGSPSVGDGVNAAILSDFISPTVSRYFYRLQLGP